MDEQTMLHEHVHVPDAAIPAILAVEWKQGMGISPDTLVSHKGDIYFNLETTALNFENPAESDKYSKALVGAKVVKFLVNHYGSA